LREGLHQKYNDQPQLIKQGDDDDFDDEDDDEEPPELVDARDDVIAKANAALANEVDHDDTDEKVGSRVRVVEANEAAAQLRRVSKGKARSLRIKRKKAQRVAKAIRNKRKRHSRIHKR